MLILSHVLFTSTKGNIISQKWRRAIPLQFCKNMEKWTYILKYNTNSQRMLNQGGYIGHLQYREIHSHGRL